MSDPIATLRKRHYALETLPATIRLTGADIPVEDATLDDIAFALLEVEAEFNAVADRQHALRKLYALARQAGGRGADRAADAIAAKGNA